MSEENNVNPFTQRIDATPGETKPQEAPKSPFANVEHNEVKTEKPAQVPAPQKPKKKLSVYVLLGGVFFTLILLVVFLIFVMAVGGTENPVLQTFGIDPLFLKDSLLALTNAAFGAITFVLFILLVIGVFRGIMAKKDDVQKRKTSFVLSGFSFGMMFITILIWLGVFNFISTFVVNADAATAKILFSPSQEFILKSEPPIEIIFSAEQAKKAWERKGRKIQGFAWDLNNDGEFEFQTQDVQFIQEMNASGKTQVRLMTLLDNGDQDIISQEIVFPQAVFDYRPKSGTAPLAVTFDATKFSDSKNPISEYAWDFNEDGDFEEVTSKGKIEYTFKKIGTYTVQLRTKTLTGKIARYEAKVNVLSGIDSVEMTQAVISADPALSGEAPFKIRLSGEKSASPDGNIVLYRWNFGDGTFMQEGKVVDHIFTNPGEYRVVLTVKDEKGNDAQIDEKLIVRAKKDAPVAVITSNPAVLEGTAPFTVDFDAASSTDSDKNIVDYLWDWNNDGKTDVQGQKFTYVFREMGSFPVKLTVVDADKNQSDATVVVKVTDGKLDARIVARPESGAVPLTVDFDASNSVSTKGKIISYEWDFGDGTLPQLAGAQKSHRFTRVGVYTVKVKVFTDLDEEATVETKIYARVVPTQSCFTVSRHEVSAGSAVSFDSACSIGNIASWKWDFADGTISRERKPDHVFEKRGVYEVTLEIVDAQNNVSKYSDTIEVK